MLEIQKKLSSSFFVLLSLPSTAMGFALSIQIAALSWILNTKYGFDIHEVGIVWAAGPIAGIIGQPLAGLASDKVWFLGGRRRPFILIGGILTSLMLLALPNIHIISDFLGFAPTKAVGDLAEGQFAASIYVAIAVALILDLSINISFNPTRSIIADVTNDDTVTKGYTWMQTISGTFGVLAYFIGSVLGNNELIYIGVFLVFLFSVVPVFFIEEPKSLKEVDEEVHDGKSETDTKGFIKVLLAHAPTWLGIQTMFVFMFAYVQQKYPDFSSKEVGSVINWSFLIFNAVAAILPAFILEPITHKIGRVKTHAICIGIMALGYAGMIAVGGTSEYMIYGMMVILGIGWAATVSLPFAIMSEKVEKAKMGLYMGIFNLSVVLPQLAVSVFVSKYLADAEDKTVMFYIAAIALAVSAVLWLFVKDSSSPQGDQMKPAGGGHH
ncbi:MFS transporter [Flammeovirga kamogawensis]|uniref:MFS transporter n=1 Tax=Flammeovirga kamogawensis TaxID=373891 RepID=A0ABX8GTV2_9BACT|nr:MFS transporter [Flammeovirga kamogawensis]MBB6460119.1 MFS family permease [Flammeovirga kamogawensis]QWG06839.1 MFS transporter [Flammeovirga kamogawensis]TRX68663.1 SLC45 family MFS transporter [Flammeovirga kamogawensis]